MGETKPAWQYTRAEYLARLDAEARRVGNPGAGTPEMDRVNGEDHEQEVRWAVKDGLPVSAEVTADYPALLAKSEP